MPIVTRDRSATRRRWSITYLKFLALFFSDHNHSEKKELQNLTWGLQIYNCAQRASRTAIAEAGMSGLPAGGHLLTFHSLDFHTCIGAALYGVHLHSSRCACTHSKHACARAMIDLAYKRNRGDGNQKFRHLMMGTHHLLNVYTFKQYVEQLYDHLISYYTTQTPILCAQCSLSIQQALLLSTQLGSTCDWTVDFNLTISLACSRWSAAPSALLLPPPPPPPPQFVVPMLHPWLAARTPTVVARPVPKPAAPVVALRVGSSSPRHPVVACPVSPAPAVAQPLPAPSEPLPSSSAPLPTSPQTSPPTSLSSSLPPPPKRTRRASAVAATTSLAVVQVALHQDDEFKRSSNGGNIFSGIVLRAPVLGDTTGGLYIGSSHASALTWEQGTAVDVSALPGIQRVPPGLTTVNFDKVPHAVILPTVQMRTPATSFVAYMNRNVYHAARLDSTPGILRLKLQITSSRTSNDILRCDFEKAVLQEETARRRAASGTSPPLAEAVAREIASLQNRRKSLSTWTSSEPPTVSTIKLDSHTLEHTPSREIPSKIYQTLAKLAALSWANIKNFDVKEQVIVDGEMRGGTISIGLRSSSLGNNNRPHLAKPTLWELQLPDRELPFVGENTADSISRMIGALTDLCVPTPTLTQPAMTACVHSPSAPSRFSLWQRAGRSRRARAHQVPPEGALHVLPAGAGEGRRRRPRLERRAEDAHGSPRPRAARVRRTPAAARHAHLDRVLRGAARDGHHAHALPDGRRRSVEACGGGQGGGRAPGGGDCGGRGRRTGQPPWQRRGAWCARRPSRRRRRSTTPSVVRASPVAPSASLTNALCHWFAVERPSAVGDVSTRMRRAGCLRAVILLLVRECGCGVQFISHSL